MRGTVASSRRGARSAHAAVGVHGGFVWEGLRAVLGWVGLLCMGAAALAAWSFRRVAVWFQGERGLAAKMVLLASASLYLFVALLDYERGDIDGNICGAVGYNLAHLCVMFLGLGAYLPPLFGAFWGVAALLGKPRGGAALRTLGVLILTLTVAVGATGVTQERPPDRSFPLGLGGWVGREAFPTLAASLGSFGVALLLALTGLLALLLATEWGFIPLVRELVRHTTNWRQPELPLAEAKPKLRAEAAQQKEQAATGLRRVGVSLMNLLRPFHPAEEPQMALAGVPGGALAVAPEPEKTVAAAKPAEPTLAPVPPLLWPEKAAPAAVETEEDAVPEAVEEEAAEEGADRPARRPKKAKPTVWSLPPTALLRSGERRDRVSVQGEIDNLGRRLQKVFDDFGLEARVVGAERGPTLTLFEVQLASGVSVKRLKNQRDDLGVALGSHGVRIVYPLPGRSTVGIEVPNLKRETVRLKDVFDEVDMSWERNKLPMVLGRDTLGRPAVEDLTVMPHALIAGTTGSGKSVSLNSVLCSWLLTRTPDQMRLVLIDPKQVELQLYRDIPHLLCPVVTDMKRAPFVLEWATRQMEDRLHMFKLAGVRNIGDYNALGRKQLQERLGEDYDPEEFPDALPLFVLVIDELADLMLVSAKEVEIAISRLAAKARAAGIHLLVATQRPSTDVVTGLIKMNLPVRLAFKVTSAVDSRVILDEGGAEDLLGNGDFLYRPPGASGMTRGQGAFVSESEVREVCDHLRASGKPEFLEELVQQKGPAAGEGGVDDPLYEDAVRIILQSGRGSASLLQRALSVGYTRASRLIDIMTEQGVLGPFTGSKARDVLLTLEQWEAQRKSAAGE